MKKLLALLLTLLLCTAALPACALEMTDLPETFAELQAMLPEMPSLTPEGIAFYVPTYDEITSGTRNFEFICDQEKWIPRPASIEGHAVEFIYDEAAGAYVVDEKFLQIPTFGVMTGMMTSTFTITSAEQVNGWTLNAGFYFDYPFMEGALFREGDITEQTWLNVAETGDSNYFMPNVIAQYPLDNGYLQVWLYASKTIAVIRSAEGRTLVSKTYPEFSEWCGAFMPTFQ